MSSNSHIELHCQEVADKVKKEKVEKKEEVKVRNVKVHIRKAQAQHLKKKKWVQIGKQ